MSSGFLGVQVRCSLLLYAWSGRTPEYSGLTVQALPYLLLKASHSLAHGLAGFFRVPPSAKCSVNY